MAKSTVKSTPKTLDIIKNDPWLKDYEVAIVGRHRHAEDKIAELTQNGKCSLSDFRFGILIFRPAPHGYGVGVPRMGAPCHRNLFDRRFQ